jgi:subfamily B ATP-binding cassette protein MsbA
VALLKFILRGHWSSAGILFALLLFTSIMEGIGFSLVIPLLQVMLFPTADLAGGNSLQRAIGHISAIVPPDWRLSGLLGLITFVFVLKSLGLASASALTRWFVDTLRMDWLTVAFLAHMKAPYSQVAVQSHGEVLQNIVGETEGASRSVLLLIESAARIIQMTVLVVILLLANWRAALFVLIIGGVAYSLSWRISRRFSLQAGRTRQIIRQRTNDVVSECITGLRTVKLLDIAASRAKQLRHMLRNFRRVDSIFEVISVLPSNMIDLVAVVVGVAVIFFMTTVLGLRIEEAVPTTALFGLVFIRLAGSSGFLFSRGLNITTLLPSLWTVHEMMRISSEQTSGSTPFPGITGDIVFEDVAVGPPGRQPIFDGLSMKISPKGLTAIVGPSGSGKTTLVDLIVRLREPDGGRVLINGRDVREFDVRSLRKRVGYLSQEPQLFNGTVEENLRLGRPDATDAEIVAAAKRAHIHDVVVAMPDDYDTELGRGAVAFSGGQRQRLALARELLRNPALYIFDEPTSALDEEAESVISELINELAQTHPVIIISHRAEIIFGAKVIYRLENGKAVEQSRPEPAKVSAGVAP